MPRRPFIIARDGGFGGEVVTVEIREAAVEALSAFMRSHAAEIDEILAPHGVSMDTLLMPDWRRAATIEDLRLFGDGDEVRSGLAEQMRRLREREEKSA